MSLSSSQIGPYQCQQVLGQGGAGTVYLAQDSRVGAKVALKVLHGSFAGTRQAKALLSEALLARRIESEYCVRTLDILNMGESRAPILVNEYIEGLNAREFLDQVLFPILPGGRMSPLSACLIFEQMMRGLRAAHELGIIHQDIKPENFLVSRVLFDEIEALDRSLSPDLELEEVLWTYRDTAWIKLSDWGLALIREQDLNSSRSLSMSISQIPEGKRGGTLVYMSPEQIDGLSISRRSDVFSCALIFYELLTGQSPFVARLHSENLTDSCFEDVRIFVAAVASAETESVIHAAKDPHLAALSYWPELIDCLERMGLRDKGLRPSSRELLEDIEGFIEHPVVPVQRSLWPLVAGLGALLGFIALTLVLFVPGPGDSTQPVKPPDPVTPTDAALADEVKALRDKRWESLAGLQQVNEEICQLAIGKPGTVLRFPQLKSLDAACAKILASYPGEVLVFDRLETLETDAARALGAFKGPGLGLCGLKELSPEALAALCRNRPRGGIDVHWSAESLPLIREIWACPTEKTPTLQSFGRRFGRFLWISGALVLTEDHVKAARELINHSLALKLINEPRPGVVQQLFQGAWPFICINDEALGQRLTERLFEQSCFKNLIINHIREFRSDRVEAIRCFNGVALFLNGPKRCSPAIAGELSKFSGHSLGLSCLTQLDEITAQKLAYFPGDLLLLNGLENNLDLGVFRALTESRARSLALEGMDTLSPAQARAFRTFRGASAWFGGLSQLDAETARELALLNVKYLSLEGLRSLDQGTAEALSGFGGVTLVLDGVRELSPEAARALSQFAGTTLALNGLQVMTRAVAEALSQYQGIDMELSGLKELDLGVAQALKNFPGERLELQGVEDLSLAASRELAQCSVFVLDLSGLKRCRSDVLSALTSFPGEQLLLGLEDLDPSRARVLTQFVGRSLDFRHLKTWTLESLQILVEANSQQMSLGGIQRLTEAEAKVLASFDGHGLAFPDLIDLSPEVASRLKAFPGQALYFIGLGEIQPSVAEALSQFRGSTLEFHKVRHLSERSASYLSQFEGDVLNLEGLLKAWDEGLSRLVSFSGSRLQIMDYMVRTDKDFLALSRARARTMHLSNVVRAQASQLRQLAKYSGADLYISLTRLRNDQVEALAAYRGRLFVTKLHDLNTNVARSIAAQPRFPIGFSTLARFRPGVVEALQSRSRRNVYLMECSQLSLPELEALISLSGGVLSLDSLTSLSLDQASALRRFPGSVLTLNGLRRLEPGVARMLSRLGCQMLTLNGLQELSPQDAGELAKFRGQTLTLAKLQKLSPGVGTALSQWRGRVLSLDGLRELSLEGADGLSRFRGSTLSLRRLRKVNELVLGRLAPFKGRTLSLNGLQVLTVEQARALAKCQCAVLHFGSVHRLSPRVCRALRDFRGQGLLFNGLFSLPEGCAQEMLQWQVENIEINGMRHIRARDVAILKRFKGKIYGWAELESK